MFKAIVFDIDGVLTKIESIWDFIHEKLGLLEKAEKNAEAYFKGEITYEEWAKLDVELWKGLSYDYLKKLVRQVPLRNGCKETISIIKKWGLITCAISAGLEILALRVKEELGLDYTFANKLVVKNGKLTGDIMVRVTSENKDGVLLNFCKLVKIKPQECIVVGDSVVDIPMFRLAGYSIAYNPTSLMVAKEANIIILSENLKCLLPIIRNLIRA